MGAGRLSARPGSRFTSAGFSLIELLVSVSLLGVLLAMALPAFSEWIRNNQVRVAAETLREGLQLARSEAVKRNTRMRMQLVTSLDNSCALSTAGPYWIVNAGSSVTPAGACATPISATTTPYVVQASPATASATKVTVLASQAVVAFDAAGRQAVTLNPNTVLGRLQVDISSPGGTCLLSGGNVRCLRLYVNTGGEVRMCDPFQTSSTDPTVC